MSKYRVLTFIYFVSLAVWLFVMRGGRLSFFVALGSVPVYLGVLAWGAFTIRAQFYLTACNGSSTDEKIISLTFDDGPNIYTKEIVDVLARKNISATFFFIGKNIAGNPALVSRVAAADHAIGNHTWSHATWFDLFTKKRMIDDIARTDALIKEITGASPKYFRPPYGVTNPVLARALKAFSYHVIGWRFRTLDTMIHDGTKICERVTKKIKPGDILVFHDFTENVGAILEKVIDYCIENDFRIVTLDELMDHDSEKCVRS